MTLSFISATVINATVMMKTHEIKPSCHSANYMKLIFILKMITSVKYNYF